MGLPGHREKRSMKCLTGCWVDQSVGCRGVGDTVGHRVICHAGHSVGHVSERGLGNSAQLWAR